MQSTQETTCTVEGCNRRRRDGGYCPAHGQRVRRHGVPGAAAIAVSSRTPSVRSCSVPDCGRAHYCKGMCTMHYQRQRNTGDLSAPEPRIGARNPSWRGDNVGYRAVHTRLTSTRGRAADLQCVDCGTNALQWSYDNADPDEKHDPDYGAFSTNLDRYSPRCRRCHHAFDCRTSATHVHDARMCFHTA